MTEDLEGWIAARTPPAVMPLGRWVSRSPDAASDRVGVLTELAVGALQTARAHPGRVRESAFDLLAADALLTYACEAALESADAEGSLLRILRRACAG
ncbi:MAG: hypothetical protein U5R14_05070 [Gemmatimonadota bacterium]|nr:hypothetical protein [Gemmatimonadota bacterium]